MMEYYTAMRKKENLPFASAWMDLEGIMLSEISQTEKDKYYTISLYMGNLKRNCTKQRGDWWWPGTGRWEKWVVAVQESELPGRR